MIPGKKRKRGGALQETRNRGKAADKGSPQQKRKIIDGDCRECINYDPPTNTGRSEDIRVQTANFTVRPCGEGKCVDKRFESRDGYKKRADKGVSQTELDQAERIKDLEAENADLQKKLAEK